MGMEPDEALSFIDFLFEKDAEDKIYLRWIVGPQFSYSLDEFKEFAKMYISTFNTEFVRTADERNANIEKQDEKITE